jgi:hypothetical protein
MEEKMNQFGTNHYMLMEIKKQHDDLVEQLRTEKQVRESIRTEKQNNQHPLNILAMIERRRARSVPKLERRVSYQPESKASLSQQSNPEGCP